MKAVFAALITLAVLAFAFTSLPSDFAGLISQSVNPQQLKEELALWLQHTFASARPADTRLALIGQIETSLTALQTSIAPDAASTTPAASAGKTPLALVQETENLVSQLKDHNADTGVIQTAENALIAKVLPPGTPSCSQEAPR